MTLQENYVKEINSLKDQIKNKNNIIKEMKLCLFAYEEQIIHNKTKLS